MYRSMYSAKACSIALYSYVYLKTYEGKVIPAASSVPEQLFEKQENEKCGESRKKLEFCVKLGQARFRWGGGITCCGESSTK